MYPAGQAERHSEALKLTVPDGHEVTHEPLLIKNPGKQEVHVVLVIQVLHPVGQNEHSGLLALVPSGQVRTHLPSYT